MRRLSSTLTMFYKRVFPVIWLLVMASAGFTIWKVSERTGNFEWPSLMPVLFMLAIGSILYKTLISGLLDEVWLDGQYLLVKNRGQQARLRLADVVNVNFSTMTNPRRITVMLRTDSPFGRHVTFMPVSSISFMSAFKPDPIATDLIERVDAIRQERR